MNSGGGVVVVNCFQLCIHAGAHPPINRHFQIIITETMLVKISESQNNTIDMNVEKGHVGRRREGKRWKENKEARVTVREIVMYCTNVCKCQRKYLRIFLKKTTGRKNKM